jgi:hypothetical protein
MASYRGHLGLSIPLGIAYAAGGAWICCIDPLAVAVAGIVTGVSGVLPDLDSDNSVPVRVLFGIASIIAPLLLVSRLLTTDLMLVELLLAMAGSHLLIRYVLSAFFKRLTVHRGMFHSIPAMFICGLTIFLFYHHPQPLVRIWVAGGAMLGFLSHLVLDEIYSVDLVGVRLRLNKAAGSAVKFFSPSWKATLGTYAVLLVLALLAALEFDRPREQWRQMQASWNISRNR